MVSRTPLEVAGRLEDASLFETLQIIGWLKKTGRVRVQSPDTTGVVLIRDGLVVGAYTERTIARLRRPAKQTSLEPKDDGLQSRTMIVLQELADLREGEFYFIQDSDLSVPDLEPEDLSAVVLEQGLHPDHLALVLAQRQDQEPGENDAEAPPQQAQGPITHYPVFWTGEKSGQAGPGTTREDRLTVLLVDDEAPVLDVLGAEIRSAGHQVFAASGPNQAVSMAWQLARTRENRLVVVADTEMPTSSQKSFLGGFELVRKLAKMGVDAPVLLMAEKLSERSRVAAKKLGIRKVAFKPALSKLDPEHYHADLRAFAGLVLGLLREIGCESYDSPRPAPRPRLAQDPLTLNFLSSMSTQLTDPGRAMDVSKHVLPVAACLGTRDDDKGYGSPLENIAWYKKHEGRRFERLVSLSMSVEFRHGNEIGKGCVTDLSEEGAFLSTSTLCPVGEVIRLRIFLPGSLGEVSAEARVVWLSYESGDKTATPRGMGIAFLGLFS